MLATAPQSPPARLLLVDDEVAFVDALAFRLEARGYVCQRAYRGEEALALLDNQEIEVMLLDVNMPGLHGIEALKLVKEKHPEIEVILLTGEANFSLAGQGMRRGASDYLLKPVDFSALLTSIEKAGTRARNGKERQRAAAAGKLMALGVLAAGVGHEINNPLQIIMQRSEWLAELLEDAKAGKPDYAELERTAASIQAQAMRCGAITAQLLELAGKTRNSTAESDVVCLLDKVCTQMAERLHRLNITVEKFYDADLPLIACSPAELEPVFIHLVRNAVDALEAVVDPATEEKNKDRTGLLQITAQALEGKVRIMIADSGEGISPAHEASIFEPFFSTRPVGKGTGLGLTVCHSIISALRGSIQYAPSALGGASFIVEIPVCKHEPEVATSPTAAQ